MTKVIAIDFDGCLCTNNWPDVGEPNWNVINRARDEQKNGAKLILWTCRDGPILDAAVKACESWGLTFDAVNENLEFLIKKWGNDTRKIGANEYWDDRAVRMDSDYVYDGGPNTPNTITKQKLTRQRLTRKGTDMT
jgi:hypothetical protein